MGIEREKPTTEPPYVLTEGIRIYGEKIGVLDKEEVNRIETPNKALLHVTRHLNDLSPEARLSLTGINIKDGDTTRTTDDHFLTTQLESKGSKFHPKITDPRTLIHVCKEIVEEQVGSGQEIPWIMSSKDDHASARIKVTIDVRTKEKLGLATEDFLGTVSVIEITSELAPLVKRELRGAGEQKDHIEVQVIEGKESEQIDTLIIELRKTQPDDAPFFYTAYTGILAPRLPRPEEQSPEEVDYNREWWERHAFLKK